MRKILHVDMDAFYASVEQRDDPSLRGKPVAVGGSGQRGVVMTASYEARQFGVKSAMPSVRAQRLCPRLIFVRPRFEAYKEASKAIRKVFDEYAELVEPLSLDEAFLDVTSPKRGPPSATLIAREIKNGIRSRTGLTASAGVSSNKFLAKVASGMNKPDGLTVIEPEEAEDFVARLPIEKFFGVGPATSERLKKLGIYTGGDLKNWSRPDLVRHFGKSGHYFYRLARGVDDRPVRSGRTRKSIGAERTFSEDLFRLEDMLHKLEDICAGVARRMRRSNCAAHTITIKIKYLDFVVSTRSRTFSQEISEEPLLREISHKLLSETPPDRPVRLLGVSVSNLISLDVDGHQLPLEFH